MRKLRVVQVALLASIGTPAFAQTASTPSPSTPPSAVSEGPEAQLFEEGRAAYARGEFSLACQKFGQSTALKASVGGYLNWANCLERIEHVTEAASVWQSAVSEAQSAGDTRGGYAQQRLADLGSRIPTIAFRRGTLPEGGTVTLDEHPVSAFAAPQPVDPGEHAIVVRAPGSADRAFRVFIVMNEHRELTAEPGASLTPTPSVRPAAAPSAPSPPPLIPPTNEHGAPKSKIAAHTWLIIGGSVGLGLSVLSGALVLDAKAGVKRDCDAQGTCNPDGISAAHRGRVWSQVGTWSFVGGAALLGTGLTLHFIGDKPDPTHASGWALTYQGRF